MVPVTVALSVLLLGTLAVVGFKAHKQVLKEAEEAEKLAEAEAKKARRKAEAALQRKTEEARKKAEAKAEKTVEELWEDVWNKEPGSSHYSRKETWTTSSTNDPNQDPWGNSSGGTSTQARRDRVKAEVRRIMEEAEQKAQKERESQEARAKWERDCEEQLRQARERQAREAQEERAREARGSRYSSQSSSRASGSRPNSWGSPKTSLIQRFNTLAKEHGITPLGENPTAADVSNAFKELHKKIHPNGKAPQEQEHYTKLFQQHQSLVEELKNLKRKLETQKNNT